MKKILLLLLALGIGISFYGCSKERQLERWLIGRWNIDKGTAKLSNGTDIGLNNPGYADFREDHTGTLTFTFSGQPSSQDFKWENEAETVTITAMGQSTTNPVKVLESSRSKQVWEYRDSSNNVLNLEMTKSAE